jgi:TfoX/Sxy family transcriptional regulator of competence genes
MACDEQLAERVEAVLSEEKSITRKKMFGGLCFMHNGNMLCGITNQDNLMVRVGPQQYEDALKLKHAAEMDFTGKPLRGMIYVRPEGFNTYEALAKWVKMGLNFTSDLPAKNK